MRYLQPHYYSAHIPENRFTIHDVDLGGDYGLTDIMIYNESDSGFKAKIPPHFHLKSTHGNKSIAIRLDKPEYFMDGRNFDKLTHNQCLILDTELRKINENDPNDKNVYTHWQLLKLDTLFRPKRFRYCYVSNQPDYTKLK